MGVSGGQKDRMSRGNRCKRAEGRQWRAEEGTGGLGTGREAEGRMDVVSRGRPWVFLSLCLLTSFRLSSSPSLSAPKTPV